MGKARMGVWPVDCDDCKVYLYTAPGGYKTSLGVKFFELPISGDQTLKLCVECYQKRQECTICHRTGHEGKMRPLRLCGARDQIGKYVCEVCWVGCIRDVGGALLRFPGEGVVSAVTEEASGEIEEEETFDPLGRLSPDSFGHILSFLDFLEIISSIVLVCRSWKRRICSKLGVRSFIGRNFRVNRTSLPAEVVQNTVESSHPEYVFANGPRVLEVIRGMRQFCGGSLEAVEIADLGPVSNELLLVLLFHAFSGDSLAHGYLCHHCSKDYEWSSREHSAQVSLRWCCDFCRAKKNTARLHCRACDSNVCDSLGCRARLTSAKAYRCPTCRGPLFFSSRPATTPGYPEEKYRCDICKVLQPFPGFLCGRCLVDICRDCCPRVEAKQRSSLLQIGAPLDKRSETPDPLIIRHFVDHIRQAGHLDNVVRASIGVSELQFIAETCPNIEELWVDGAQEAGRSTGWAPEPEADSEEVVFSLSRLTRLWLRNLPRFSVLGCPKLRNLELARGTFFLNASELATLSELESFKVGFDCRLKNVNVMLELPQLQVFAIPDEFRLSPGFPSVLALQEFRIGRLMPEEFSCLFDETSSLRIFEGEINYPYERPSSIFEERSDEPSPIVSLVSVTLHIPSSPTFDKILKFLVRRAPNLEKIALKASTYDVREYANDDFSAVLLFPSLRVFKIVATCSNAPKWSSLLPIAQHPRLQRVVLRWAADRENDESPLSEKRLAELLTSRSIQVVDTSLAFPSKSLLRVPRDSKVRLLRVCRFSPENQHWVERNMPSVSRVLVLKRTGLFDKDRTISWRPFSPSGQDARGGEEDQDGTAGGGISGFFRKLKFW